MTRFNKTATLRTGDFTRLHTSFSRKMRVTINKLNGEPVPNPAGPITELQGLAGGVIPAESGSFDIRMALRQCIPVGIVRGRLAGSGGQTADIEYTVLSGLDA